MRSLLTLTGIKFTCRSTHHRWYHLAARSTPPTPSTSDLLTRKTRRESKWDRLVAALRVLTVWLLIDSFVTNDVHKRPFVKIWLNFVKVWQYCPCVIFYSCTFLHFTIWCRNQFGNRSLSNEEPANTIWVLCRIMIVWWACIKRSCVVQWLLLTVMPCEIIWAWCRYCATCWKSISLPAVKEFFKLVNIWQNSAYNLAPHFIEMQCIHRDLEIHT